MQQQSHMQQINACSINKKIHACSSNHTYSSKYPYAAVIAANIHQCWAIYYIKLKSRLSVCVTLITQPCQHQLKWDLLEMNAVSLRKTEFILKSRQKRWFFDRTAIKAKTAIIPKCPWFESRNACFFMLAQNVFYGSNIIIMAPTVNIYFIV